MKTILFFTFLISLAKSTIWILIGVLIKNHFETFWSLIIRRPVPENLINEDKLQVTNKLIHAIGVLFITIGVVLILVAIVTMSTSLSIANASNNFNIRYD
ncbi:MAG: hypothetical protein JXR05_07115 [Flavobacteriaceae bacterium]